MSGCTATAVMLNTYGNILVLLKSIAKPSWILDSIHALETANCAEKASVGEELQESVLRKSFQRPLVFVPSNNKVSRELAEWI